MTRTETAAEPVLEVEGVSKVYRIYDKPQDRLKQALFCGKRNFHRDFRALDEVTLSLKRGEFFGVIGRNGSGKSTLLQLVAGTIKPSTGQVRIRGRLAALLELGSGFNPNFTGRENVYLNGSILGCSPEEVRERFDEIAEFAEIGDFIDQPVKTYSTGMVVRLAFAVQVILTPDLLIVDEALAVGDAAFQRRCYRRLEELRERGVSLLFVSHSLELVRALCDRALYLAQGEVKALGEANTVCDAYLADLLEEQVRRKPAAISTAVEVKSDRDADASDESLLLDRYSPNHRNGCTIQGSRGIDLVSAELSHTDPLCKVLREGDWMRLHLEFEVRTPVDDFLVGVLIRDRLGADIFGFSERASRLEIPGRPQSGDKLVLDIRIKCDIRADDYFITLGVQAEGFSEILFYGHDILKFKVETPAQQNTFMIGGIARLNHSIWAGLKRD